jgi:hypothetical protein
MDRRGRVRVSVQRREELLAQFDKGETTAVQFAAFAGIKYQTLCGWLQRKRHAGYRCLMDIRNVRRLLT